MLRESGRLGQKWLLSGLPCRAAGQFSALVAPVVDMGNGFGGMRSAAPPPPLSYSCQWPQVGYSL